MSGDLRLDVIVTEHLALGSVNGGFPTWIIRDDDDPTWDDVENLMAHYRETRQR